MIGAPSIPRALRGWAFLTRTAGFTILWWILNESIVFGGVLPALSLLAAAAASLALISPGEWAWRPLQLVGFVPYFLRQALLGGFDVAWRSFHPRLPIRPGLVDYPLRLRLSSSRTLFVWVVNLLPGTAVAGIHSGGVTIHALDAANPELSQNLRQLEERVAVLFGEELRG
jgi:multicomponent Na+:H+ antiporter subunit E